MPGCSVEAAVSTILQLINNRAMNETNFEAIKAEILKRAKEAHACSEQYGRAYKSQTLQELCDVIKDNFIGRLKTKSLQPSC